METYIDLDGQILTIKYFHDRKEYYNSGNLYHRLDGPAIEYSDGSYSWKMNGKSHRIGGPQCFYPHYYMFITWHVNGKRVEVYYICG